MQDVRHTPIALGVMLEELEAIARRFDAIASSEDVGDRRALLSDLVTAMDRYIRLEEEVFYPVLRRSGVDSGHALSRHADLRRAMTLAGNAEDDSDALGSLRDAFEIHRAEQTSHTFPRAARAIGKDLPELALELDEVRQRMRGAYGV